MSDDEITGRAKGGKARAAALSPERRREIAVAAATKRWAAKPGRVVKVGDLKVKKGRAGVLVKFPPDVLIALDQRAGYHKQDRMSLIIRYVRESLARPRVDVPLGPPPVVPGSRLKKKP